VNLRVMGRSNIPLLNERSLSTLAADAGTYLLGNQPMVLLVWQLQARDVATLLFAFLVTCVVGLLLYAFLRTDIGTALRATGDNPQMIRALGVDTGLMTLLGLALSNSLVGLSGALLAQYEGFADVQMGIGMIVWGLASVIIGEGLVRTRLPGLAICGTIMGCVLFRLLIAIALRFGLNPNDLKLVTAAFVFLALALPALLARLKTRRKAAADA
jgi:putative tryptophan/tyrosine transport system permease protein